MGIGCWKGSRGGLTRAFCRPEIEFAPVACVQNAHSRLLHKEVVEVWVYVYEEQGPGGAQQRRMDIREHPLHDLAIERLVKEDSARCVRNRKLYGIHTKRRNVSALDPLGRADVSQRSLVKLFRLLDS